jgi:hypothetical protein
MQLKKPGHIQPEQTELNSGTKTFPVQAHLEQKPFKVDVSDPHGQAKDEGKGYACTARIVKRAK